MKKTMKSLIIVIFLIIIAGIVIIAANQDQVGHIPISVRNLEQNIEFFDGAEFDITTDQTNYSQGEEITITAVSPIIRKQLSWGSVIRKLQWLI